MKSFAVLGLLLHIAHGLADAECSESPGSCIARRSSLMQVRSLQRKSNAATSMRAKLAGFQQFTEKMIAKFGSDQDPPAGVDDTPAGVNDTSSDFTQALPAVKLVLGFIYNMSATLLEYHNQDLLKVGDCNQVYQNCIAVHVNQTDVDYEKALREGPSGWLTLKGAHETCRDERQALQNGESAACLRYDEYRQNTADTSALLPSCVGNKAPPGELDEKPCELTGTCLDENAFYEEYVKAQYFPRSHDPCVHLTPSDCNTTKEELKTFEGCLEDTNDWLVPLWERFKACQRNDDLACNGVNGEKRIECKNRQHQFEEKHCAWSEWKDLKCGVIHNCVVVNNNTCQTVCAGVEQDAAARAADNETGLRLECLLEVLFGEQTDDTVTYPTGFKPRLSAADRQVALNTCKNNAYNTSFWDISCPVGWDSDHPHLPFDCTCDEVSDAGEFLTEYFYDNPPGLGLTCTETEEKDSAIGQLCCTNRNITSSSTCVWDHSTLVHCQSGV